MQEQMEWVLRIKWDALRKQSPYTSSTYQAHNIFSENHKMNYC